MNCLENIYLSVAINSQIVMGICVVCVKSNGFFIILDIYIYIYTFFSCAGYVSYVYTHTHTHTHTMYTY